MNQKIPIVKLIVIGDSGVGKSSLSEYYILNKKANQKHTPTIGVEFYTKFLTIKDKKFKLQVWDTAGQEKFKAVTKAYFRDAFGALICFPISNRKSFLNLRYHINDLTECGRDNVVKILVGTCCDLKNKREVSVDEAQEYANKLDVQYIETSAVTGYNINKCFDIVLDKIDKQIEKKIINPVIIKQNSGLPPVIINHSGYCCS